LLNHNLSVKLISNNALYLNRNYRKDINNINILFIIRRI